MIYMLDTNICIYIIKEKPPAVIQNFLKHSPDEICISSITYSELMYGVEKSKCKDKNRLALTMLLSSISILDYDSKASIEYGAIRSYLESRGIIIGPLDMLIASHAKSQNLILVSNNTKEFERVIGLSLENWTI